MNRIDPNRRHLEDEPVHHLLHRAVDARDVRRTGIRLLLGQPTEEDDRPVFAHPVEELMDRLRIPDHLEDGELGCALDVELAEVVRIAEDGWDDQVVDGAFDRRQAVSDPCRLREVDCDPVGVAADPCCGLVGASLVAARHVDTASLIRVVLGDRLSDAGRRSDDHDTSTHFGLLLGPDRQQSIAASP